MIALVPIEPVSEAHGALIVAAFGRLLIDAGGQPAGGGDGGGAYGRVKIPDEWRVDESNGAPADGQNQEMLDERKR